MLHVHVSANHFNLSFNYIYHNYVCTFESGNPGIWSSLCKIYNLSLQVFMYKQGSIYFEKINNGSLYQQKSQLVSQSVSQSTFNNVGLMNIWFYSLL